ncbi:hypothetical protein [Microbacterium sp. BLY]|uniref:hypothetical protein n=1 Tax=Microbacterium sp. BLY TaxID=2823280 RepID=UPI001B320B0F|nr:hypothetical protein [Microbacterium sp. BLY]MBP3977589.1 hypothetical protein [Microbacterium sp. BLY]
MAMTTSGDFHAVSITQSIAPNKQVDLGASDARSAEWQGVDSDIEMNVLAVWAAEDPLPVLFVTLDLLYPGQRIREAVEAAAPSVPADRIVVAASHTHRAPMTDPSKPALGTPDEEYMQWVTGVITQTVRTVLLSPRQPVSISVGDTSAAHSINRRLRKRVVVARRPRLNAVVNAPNPDGPTDEQLTALMVRDAAGKPLALVWNYTCHPVGGPVRNAVSSHYPGAVRETVREALDAPALPVLFFQGFSGDVRPNASTKVHSLRRRMRQLISGRLFEDMTWTDYREWCRGLSAVLLRALDETTTVGAAGLTGQRHLVPVERLVKGRDAGVMSFGRLGIGDLVTIYTASGELVVDYALHARRAATSRFVLCVGCVDDVVGYIPSHRVQDEGGYEGGGFARAFGLEGLQDDVQEVVVDAFRALDKTGDRWGDGRGRLERSI